LPLAPLVYRCFGFFVVKSEFWVNIFEIVKIQELPVIRAGPVIRVGVVIESGSI